MGRFNVPVLPIGGKSPPSFSARGAMFSSSSAFASASFTPPLAASRLVWCRDDGNVVLGKKVGHAVGLKPFEGIKNNGMVADYQVNTVLAAYSTAWR